jgi:RNase P subunit RPR2
LTVAKTAESDDKERVPMDLYCVKCKKKTPSNDTKEVTLANGKPAVQGTCSVCGTKQTQIGKLK